MPTREDISSFVLERIHARSPASKTVRFTDTDSLVALGLIDSFAFLDLVSQVEKRFGVEIDLGAYDFEEISTIDGMCRAVLAGA